MVTGVIIYIQKNIWAQIIAFTGLVLTSIFIVKFDIMHPYCWFSGMFWLYSISYPILYCTGNLDAWLIKKAGYPDKVIFLEWAALSVFLLIVSPSTLSYTLKKNKTFLLAKANIILYMVMYVIIIMAIISISQSGYVHKSEIYASHNFLYRIAFISIYLLLTFYVLMCLHYKNNRWHIKLLTYATFALTLQLSMYTGERDIFFTYLLLTIFILYLFGTIKKYHFLFLVPLGVLILPISNIYKSFFLTHKSGNIFSAGFIKQFFDSEFRAASTNVQILLNNANHVKGVFSYDQIFKDIQRVFISNTESTLGWYNDLFFSYTKTGYGFTLVGEGYVIDELLGIIVLFIIIGIFVRCLYQLANKNIYMKTLYIYSIPNVIYSIRADLTNIFSPILKHIILALVVIFIIQKLFVFNFIPEREKNRGEYKP